MSFIASSSSSSSFNKNSILLTPVDGVFFKTKQTLVHGKKIQTDRPDERRRHVHVMNGCDVDERKNDSCCAIFFWYSYYRAAAAAAGCTTITCSSVN